MAIKKPLDLEASMSEINILIEQMEQGDQNLEQSLVRFERGIQLIKNCQKIIQDAEQKVNILLQRQGEPTLEVFEINAE